MEKKKILFIIWSFTYGGGAEKVLANLVNRMNFDKYEIDIIEYWHSDINIEKVDKRVNILKPIVDSTKASKIQMYITKILLEHFPFILRKKFLGNKKYDYEIAFNCMIPTFFVNRNGKTISWIHTDLYDMRENNHDWKLQNKSFNHINRIVAISQNTYNSILELFPQYKSKTCIINNSFDFDNIYALSKKKLDIDKKEFTMLFAGRLDDRKNPLFLIEVARVLKEKNICFNLWMIGRGILEEKINEKINEYNLDKEIKILGFQKNPYPFFKATDIVVMSSKNEGFPTVIAEGLALGKPFVSTNVGGTYELSDNGKCGIIADSVDEYANAVIKLIEDNQLYKEMSNYGKKHISKFTYENQIKKLESLFEEIENEEKNKS